jgi:hypothetical protein
MIAHAVIARTIAAALYCGLVRYRLWCLMQRMSEQHP